MLTPIYELVAQIAKQLCSPCLALPLAEQEAWWMLEDLTEKSKAALCAARTIDFSDEQQKKLSDWIVQRVEQKKPLQYILGSVPFCDLNILVKSPILIPRPETEEWVTWLIDCIKPNRPSSLKILDLCSGSGCIGLALAHHLPQATVVGVDINPSAIALAQENQKFNNISNIHFVASNLYEQLCSEKFDLIVTNPPYLSDSEYEEIADDVKKWEDRKALVADGNGMYFYHRIIESAKSYLETESRSNSLQKTPAFICEIGPTQSKSIEGILVRNNFKNIQTFRDLQGKVRWIAACI